MTTKPDPQRGLHFQRPRTPARLSVRLRTYRPGGKAAIWIWHRLELRPLGAPGRGRGRQPEPKGDPTEPEGQPWPDKDNFQVPWSSPPIGMLGGRRAPERDFPRCGRGTGQGWGVGCGCGVSVSSRSAASGLPWDACPSSVLGGCRHAGLTPSASCMGLNNLPAHKSCIQSSLPCQPKFCPINKPRQFLYSLMVITAHRGDSHITASCSN
ncbi:uncharacterized protein [Alexandromys fortis]|uniref:uncharacterized protein n=1 Tax=Alexandromys fortis TaxID=100897 RepID=UPI0021534359|nr:uncharacterized protein LOC126490161 [Microtus fortis]